MLAKTKPRAGDAAGVVVGPPTRSRIPLLAFLLMLAALGFLFYQARHHQSAPRQPLPLHDQK